ncbi:hypothetical protein BOX37_24965 [Nocardia mangyaensis]|uniref:DUF320 domain-containing protein n=1 Tax=Nocardia mangyaensis TaxID=2213200 RepID=A0A1J0VX61_9NOCA|nr:hypothetical protein [Nocardia mangyaensis]APE36636.1 hypothetical protein BOX37_24965 [Nocardia mangyaensis]
MNITLRLATAAIATAALVATAAGATADPRPAPSVVAEAGTGSAAADTGSAAANSVGSLVQRGDIIGVIVLLGITPIQMVTGGICDLATGSGLASPCAGTGRY